VTEKLSVVILLSETRIAYRTGSSQSV